MAHLSFTPNLSRLVGCPEGSWPGRSVREVLEAAFRDRPGTRSYVLDDQGAVRRHVTVFLNGEQIADRARLSDPVADGDRLFVMQALSGG